MMAGPVLRAGAWPAVASATAATMAAGSCGVLFPAATTVLFLLSFALLAAASAFTLDEPASLVVDVTPTEAFRRTAVRALALLVPLTAGAVLLVAGALRGLALPWGSAALALAGNVLLGFAVAAVGRTRTGEPGAAASAAVTNRTPAAKAGFILLVGPVRPGARYTLAAIRANKVDLTTIADIFAAAQPDGDRPRYATVPLTTGDYIAASPIGSPPNFSGIAAR